MKDHNATSRPDRFGGAGSGGVIVPADVASRVAHNFCTPDAIAPLVLEAVAHNQVFVFAHAEQRQLFRELYAGIDEAGFDDLDSYLSRKGPLKKNPPDASLPS